MPEPKTKKPAAKRAPRAKVAAKATAANTPIPCSRCGSSSCTGECGVARSVSYLGPTSHPSHHHARIAAEGQKHAWAAAVIAGLAVVITISVAYSAVQAASETRTNVRQTIGEIQIIKQIGDVRTQLNRIEKKVDALSPADAGAVLDQGLPIAPPTSATSGQQ
jgi:hypothetical protein